MSLVPYRAPVFGESLAGILEARGFTQVSFARFVGTSQSVISGVILGKRSPNLDAVGTWADALDLLGQARHIFFDLACVAHIPREHETRLAQIIYDHHRLSHQNIDLTEEVALMRHALAKLTERIEPYRHEAKPTPIPPPTTDG